MHLDQWQPIVVGAQAERCRAVVTEVEGMVLKGVAELSGEDPYFGTGLSGLVVFLAELDRGSRTLSRRVGIETALQKALETVTLRACPPGFVDGFGGVAWSARLVQSHYPEKIGWIPDMDQVQRKMARALEHKQWNGHFDLITGMAGIAQLGLFYSEARKERSLATVAVEKLISMCSTDDACWWTSLNLLSPVERGRFSGPIRNWGLAHGTPGAMAVLARSIQKGVLVDQAASLLSLVTPRIIKYMNGRGPLLPHYDDGQSPLFSGRQAWCYGPLGIGLAVFYAGCALNRADWRDWGLRIVSDAADVSPFVGRVDNPYFCHGSAGVAHLLNRLFQQTADPGLRDQTKIWMGRSLVEIETLILEGSPEVGGLLIGLPGCAAVLHSAVSSVAPLWDYPFLLFDAN